MFLSPVPINIPMPPRILSSWSIKTRVTVITVTIFVLSVCLLAFYITRVLLGEMQQQLGEQQFSKVSYIAEEINLELTERLSALQTVAASLTPAAMNSATALQAELVQRPVFQQLFNGGTFVTDAGGTAIASLPLSADRLGVNYRDRDFMVAALNEGKTSIGRPVIGKKLLAPIFVMATPIRDAHGKVVGVLGGVTNLGMSNFLDTLKHGIYGKTGGYLLMAPQHGLFVTASDKSRNMQPLPNPGANLMHDRYIQGYEGYGVATNSRGTEELSAAKGIAAAGWLIVAVLPTDEAFAPAHKMQTQVLLATLLLTVLMGGLVARSISLVMKRQLAPMLATARSLAELSVSDQPAQRLPIARQDEIGELIGGFNRVLQTLAQREADLQVSKDFALSIMDAVAAEIVVVDSEALILATNQRWRSFAMDNSNVPGTATARTDIGTNYLAVCQTSGGADTQVALAARAGIEAVLAGSLPLFSLQYPCHSPLQQRWFTMLVTPFGIGTQAGAAIVHIDVTELKLAEIKLLEQEGLYRSVVDHGQALIWLAGLDKGCYFFNQPWLSFTGRTLAQETGNGWAEGVHPDDLQRCLAIYVTAFDRREAFSMVYRLRRHDGEYRWILDDGAPRYDSSQAFVGYVGHCLDVTERQQAMQQMADQKATLETLVGQRTSELTQALALAKFADQAKDAFLANMSHELRTPLSAVIGMAGLAQSLSTNPLQQNYLNKVSASGKHLNRIINDLLDLSKIAAGHLAFETIPFSLQALVQQCLFVVDSRAAEKGLELVTTIDEAVPDVLLGDPLRIKQILFNLLGNAIKFTATGRVGIRVSVHARQEGRIGLAIEVQDTGIGMRPEELGLLFKPFSQADATVSRRFGGTGLGLAISKRLAEMMDGDISVTSQHGGGTTFRVHIWLGLGNAADLLRAETDDSEVPPVRYENAHVLVADDQPLNREIVEALLLAVGITSCMAENGQQALDMLIEAGPQAFDLVLMDIQMPVMDGLAAASALRSRTGFEALPIMAMTAHTLAHEKEASIAVGMNDYIGKPFDNASFYRTLAKWIPASKQKVAAGSAVVPVPPVPPHAVEQGLYGLRHTNARDGLARFNGKEDRYRHWLADFVATAGALPETMRSDIAAGHPKDAAKKAHAFRGRVGMLGMADIHLVVSTLERTLRDGEPAEELLGQLAQSIEQVRDELATFFAADVPQRRQTASPPTS